MSNQEEQKTCQEKIVFSQHRGWGRIHLNRPRVLNSLDIDMTDAISRQLVKWAEDPAIVAVMLTGEGKRAMCAGGDISAIYRNARDPSFGTAFFANEYGMNARIHHFPKPYVSLMHGVVVGGGLGVSLYGSHSIVSAATKVGMPETGIGLFPDIGAAFFLNRLPGRMGMFLAMTGKFLSGRAARAIGLVTHCVHDMDALREDLLANVDAIDETLQKHEDPAAGEAGHMLHNRARIDQLCAEDKTAAQICGGLMQEGTDDFWRDCAKRISAASPLSLHVTRAHMDAQKGNTVENILAMDFIVAQHMLRGHDFFEGVRALLIDKDTTPRWQPSELDEVDAALVRAHFSARDDMQTLSL